LKSNENPSFLFGFSLMSTLYFDDFEEALESDSDSDSEDSDPDEAFDDSDFDPLLLLDEVCEALSLPDSDALSDSLSEPLSELEAFLPFLSDFFISILWLSLLFRALLLKTRTATMRTTMRITATGTNIPIAILAPVDKPLDFLAGAVAVPVVA